MTCATPNCGGTVDVKNAATMYELTGAYRKRDEGGANHVYARRDTGRIWCPECSTRIKLGLNVKQESLL